MRIPWLDREDGSRRDGTISVTVKTLCKICLFLLIAYVGLACIVRSSSTLFWSDEIITVSLARLPTIPAIYSALRNAADSQPPLFYILERAAAHLPVNELIAFRIPSVVAFCSTILCLFVFIRQTRGCVRAIVCCIIPLLSVLYSYASVARGYDLAVAFIALAMVCYQRANTKAACLTLAISFAAATSSHYYAVFATFPFGLAELAILVARRQFRPAVWLSLFASLIPVAVFWPLLAAYKSAYGAHFVGHLSLLEVVRSYGFMWNLRPLPGLELAIATFAILVVFTFVRQKRTSPTDGSHVPLEERFLVLGFFLLPLAMGLAFAATGAGFLYRYVIYAVLGTPLVVSHAISALDRRTGIVLSALLLLALGAQEAGFRGQYWFTSSYARERGVDRLLHLAGHYDVPVAISDPNTYLEISYYASLETNRRIVYITDVPTAIRYLGSGNGDQSLLSLRPYAPLRLVDLPSFLANHPQFLIYVDRSDIWGWIQTRMSHDGYSLDTVASHGDQLIYFVHRGN